MTTPAAAAVADPMLLATDIADYLVKREAPFRNAHEIVGRAVALANQQGRALPDLPLAEYRALSPVFDRNVFRCFHLRKAMESRTAIGAPSHRNIEAQLERWRAALRTK